MELYYVLSIVDRNRAKEMQEIYENLQLSVVLTLLGKGTATSEHLSLYDLSETEKAILGTVASEPSVKQLIRTAKRKLFIDIPGNGVMMVIPIKSIGGGKSLAYLADGQTLGGGTPDMNFENELIVVILNEGYSDMVMDSAREAGATGGTVLHAKGTGRTKSEKFFGVSLAEEKDMIHSCFQQKKDRHYESNLQRLRHGNKGRRNLLLPARIGGCRYPKAGRGLEKKQHPAIRMLLLHILSVFPLHQSLNVWAPESG